MKKDQRHCSELVKLFLFGAHPDIELLRKKLNRLKYTCKDFGTYVSFKGKPKKYSCRLHLINENGDTVLIRVFQAQTHSKAERNCIAYVLSLKEPNNTP